MKETSFFKAKLRIIRYITSEIIAIIEKVLCIEIGDHLEPFKLNQDNAMANMSTHHQLFEFSLVEL